MKKTLKNISSLILMSLLVLSVHPALLAQEGRLFMEDFDSLDAWEPLYFKKIKSHSIYNAVIIDGESVLKAHSNASASAIVYKEEFDVYEYPRVRWRWKISGVYDNGDATKKAGDDYPARLYVNFLFDPKDATLGDKIMYGAMKAIYGEYPPLRSLNYVWANRAEYTQRMLPSTYTKRAMLVLVRKGDAEAGRWMTEEVDLIDDYRKAFDADPPRRVNIAIMNDSDNTGESSTSYIDFIEVLK